MEKQAHIYIYTPPWADWSAGIRVLHYLCDDLNNMGYFAFLAIHGPKTKFDVNKNLNTPVLTRKLLKSHFDSNNRILVIYPEGIAGNPLKAKFVARWVLNFPSLLAGPKSFGDEVVFAYSNLLSRSLGKINPCPIMFVPAVRAIDMEKYGSRMNIPQKVEGNSYELIYAQKFRALGGRLPKLEHNQMEITRFGRNAPTREETLQLIAGAKLIHVYENTTVITEALILGVPVLCHANEFFEELIANKELDMKGVSWDENHLETPDSEYNLNVLKEAELQSKKQLKQIFMTLDLGKNPYNLDQRIQFPRRGIITKHSLSRAKSVLIQKGPMALSRFFLNYVFRRQ